MSKPWAPSHVSEVAKGLGIDLRISGEVKHSLVILLQSKLREITKQMELETLDKYPERKTLDDPSRTRLGFNRTRGLMIDEISEVESVSSAAVISANEELERYLRVILISASEIANDDRVATIKQRHLDIAFSDSKTHDTEQDSETPVIPSEKHGSLDTKFDVLTSVSLKNIVKQLSGKKLENDALDELILLYYDNAADIEYNLQKNIALGDIEEIKNSHQKFEQLMMLGWMRRILKSASEKAESQGSNIIKLDHIVSVDQ